MEFFKSQIVGKKTWKYQLRSLRIMMNYTLRKYINRLIIPWYSVQQIKFRLAHYFLWKSGNVVFGDKLQFVDISEVWISVEFGRKSLICLTRIILINQNLDNINVIFMTFFLTCSVEKIIFLLYMQWQNKSTYDFQGVPFIYVRGYK